MCLAVPLRIIRMEGDQAEAGVEGMSRQISTALTPEVKVGDWVLVHAGFAIHRIEDSEAKETLDLLKELGDANETEI